MGLSSVQKVSRSGNSLIIIIPKKITEILKISLGDNIVVDWGEVIKVEKAAKDVTTEETIKEEGLPDL